MKTTRSFLLLLMLLATSGLNAQKEEDKYAALVSEVRNEVWSLNLPDFKNMTVPEKYRNEPAVITQAMSANGRPTPSFISSKTESTPDVW